MNKIKDIIRNIHNVTLGTWVRLILLFLSMSNMTLQAFGVNPIPISDDSIVTVLTVAFAVISGLVAYWKNNSFTEAAQSADEVLKNFRSGEYE